MSETTMIKCRYCYGEVDPRASICPHCRKNLRTNSPFWHIGSFVMAASLFAIIGGLFLEPTIAILGAIGMAVGYVVRKLA
jgi:hypothetical protein